MRTPMLVVLENIIIHPKVTFLGSGQDFVVSMTTMSLRILASVWQPARIWGGGYHQPVMLHHSTQGIARNSVFP